jgi:hydroxymethylpyrimidine pyrophosphatase-like HAD family hydrolase
MGKYKCLILDVDGTLLNSQKNISTENKKAILKLMENNGIVVIASGRAIFCLIHIFQI